ncbi:unnamed protein product [Rangifer tarandus platyrhynchus]|uniref:Uncharacterized protein n=2 Tax=Rangifer tarandus platyrhynchus TaxID=3082113 RepID=A0ABN8YNS8_RANTA|nr:unnamed protein product [Rangifer tarandus platyrhynchus]CAI9700955.1 unnamed protein product [Rangifer tarandus platyrhynchus]
MGGGAGRLPRGQILAKGRGQVELHDSSPLLPSSPGGRFYLEAAPGRPRRNVTHQPAWRGFGPKGRSRAASSASQRAAGTSPGPPRTLPRPLRALRPPSPPRLRTTSGVGCKESLCLLPPPPASA